METLIIVFGAVGVLFKGSDHIKKVMSNKNLLIKEIKRRMSIINPIYSSIEIYENGETYAYNKKEIYICLKDEHGKYYDINTLTYVALHELSHMITVGEKDDHDEKFKKNFEILLKTAKSKGIWDPKKPLPQVYCGVKH